MHGKWLLMAVLVFGVMLGAAAGLGLAQGEEAGSAAAPQALLGTAFTYQGRLNRDGSPHNGICDFRFSLYDALNGGNPVGGAQTEAGVSVDAGLFTVVLNAGGEFGDSAFNGEGRWLAVEVRCSGESAYTLLSPRQALTAAPYALALPGLWTQQNNTSPNLIGGYRGNMVTTGVEGATIGGGGSVGLANRVTDDYGAVAGGRGNRAGDNAGTTSDQAYATIGGGRDNYGSGGYSTIAGGFGNLAAGSYATIGGGGRTDPGNLGTGNRVGDDYGTVGGGGDNQAGDGDADPWSAAYATVGGGAGNRATGSATTVGGGLFNVASGSAATIAGGYDNDSGGSWATVGGGWVNSASGDYATVPGGMFASASDYGQMAYASGRFASSGDAQTSVHVLRNTTTDATMTELFLDGTDERVTLDPTATVVYDILVVARSAGDNSAGYVIRGLIENDDGWTHTISMWRDVIGEDRSAWDAWATADTTNDALVITVTGEAGYTIRWVATVRTVEVRH